MNQAERGKILTAAVRELDQETAEQPETSVEQSAEPEADVEVEAEAAETAPEATPDPKIPKRRLDEEIRKKREAEEQAAYWKGRAEASASQPEPEASGDDDDEDILSRLDRRLQSMETRHQQAEHRRALDQETAKLKAEISSALGDAPLAKAEDVAREMLLDPRMSAAEAALTVHERETQREAEILKKHSLAKQKKGDAARRPKTTGTPAIAVEEKQPVSRDGAKRAFADAFSRFKDQDR